MEVKLVHRPNSICFVKVLEYIYILLNISKAQNVEDIMLHITKY